MLHFTGLFPFFSVLEDLVGSSDPHLERNDSFNEAAWRTAFVTSGGGREEKAGQVRRPASVRSSCAATSDLLPEESKPEEATKPQNADAFIATQFNHC